MTNNTEVVRQVKELKKITRSVRGEGKKVGFVPTMGALHEGHLSLIRRSKEVSDFTVVSIFVNPLQFGPSEDYERYPREFEEDLKKCEKEGVDLVYYPEVVEMYPSGFQTEVNVVGLSKGLCGRFRPGHFKGVATVVLKLFNQVGPCIAIFGKKDYQQLKIIERMVKDLDLDVEIIGMPIVRERDGLAMSSRNRYLTEEERKKALSIVKGLCLAYDLYEKGERRVSVLRNEVLSLLQTVSQKIDYVSLADPETLEEFPDDYVIVQPKVLLAVAVHIGKARLIDNVVLGEDPRPLEKEK